MGLFKKKYYLDLRAPKVARKVIKKNIALRNKRKSKK